MKSIRRTLLALLMGFSLLGLVACDGGEDLSENGAGTELEESTEMDD